MTPSISTSSNELINITSTISQAVQTSTAAFGLLRSLNKDTRAVVVLLLSVCGLVWALNYFSTKR
jgi:thiamine phosphate synthase YjbQ (UPF0047 family)